ncbi:hypothetical protein FSP39_000671 [Pinctada imbricata]|uniref:Anaphase-promoting complex subunit 1 n=1 Tax=Pinctada imbricata TaxID=66713 RepID=A0AA88Y9U0_PINIB|nr:hypothetical protein FSP39_000671 [Pinctada imbricata]
MWSSDLNMADTLCHFMVGGEKRPMTGRDKERFRSPSYQIHEGDCVNVDVTSPGATLALGMLYFKTNNKAVADWLVTPDTQFMLDHVRPDFLLLRTLARGLVLWDSVMPSFEWIMDNIPQLIKDRAFKRGREDEDEDNLIDYETMSQGYCNIVAGACMVVGLKFAGTANAAAFDALMKCMNLSLKVMSIPNSVEQTGRSALENCMVVVLLALGMGNLEVMRLCRMLRSRIGPPYNHIVVYGCYMAISMALGLLFLGGGRYSLKSTPESIAVMLCAFFPKFPQHSNDNRYHLQAFRHLYVLAAEPRLVLPRDVDTGFPCYVPMEIRFRSTENYGSESFQTLAPSLLPQLDLIEEVKILGPRYWPIVFNINKNWNTLKLVLQNNGVLYVKQRAGHLSYVEDPKGYRSMLAKSLTSDHSSHFSTKPEVIKAFTSDPLILSLVNNFLGINTDKENPTLQSMSAILYECVTKEKPEVISSCIALQQILEKSEFHLKYTAICQLKLVKTYNCCQFGVLREGGLKMEQLIKMEFVMALISRLENILDKWQEENMELLVKYLQGEDMKAYEICHLSAYLTWFDIPTPSDIAKIVVEGAPTLPTLCACLPNLPVRTVLRILSAWTAAT